MEDWNGYAVDIAVAIVLLISAVVAYARGFVREFFSLIVWVGAIAATVYSFDYLKEYARSFIQVRLLADGLTCFVVFLVTLTLLSFITGRLARVVSGSEMGPLDRALGFIFGVARGALVLCIAYIALTWVVPRDRQPPWLNQARSMTFIRAGADWLQEQVPITIPTDHKGKATKEAERQLRDAAKEAFLRGLAEPTPKASARAENTRKDAGYDTLERRNLDRLILGTQ